MKLLPYGQKKNVYKVHPHNECDICAHYEGKREGRKKARQENKIVIKKELEMDRGV